jgi:hypothetical protein
MAGDIEIVLGALGQARVRYLVVGGVAVVLHGHLRATADLDLVVQLEEANVNRALAALEALGYRPRAPVLARLFADPEVRSEWVREKGLTVFSLWSERFPALEVDLFATEPFPFEEAYARAIEVPLGEQVVPVASLDDLIALKEDADRPEDRRDVEKLKALREAGGDDERR